MESPFSYFQFASCCIASFLMFWMHKDKNCSTLCLFLISAVKGACVGQTLGVWNSTKDWRTFEAKSKSLNYWPVQSHHAFCNLLWKFMLKVRSLSITNGAVCCRHQVSGWALISKSDLVSHLTKPNSSWLWHMAWLSYYISVMSSKVLPQARGKIEGEIVLKGRQSWFQQ